MARLNHRLEDLSEDLSFGYHQARKQIRKGHQDVDGEFDELYYRGHRYGWDERHESYDDTFSYRMRARR